MKLKQAEIGKIRKAMEKALDAKAKIEAQEGKLLKDKLTEILNRKPRR